MADSGGSQLSPKAADGKNGGAARVSYAENLAERLLSDLLTGRTRPQAEAAIVWLNVCFLA
ncbi:MAG: hypothetical protein WBN02_18565 [Sedimenticolaceae bacterium]|jgi:hypothetical protein